MPRTQAGNRTLVSRVNTVLFNGNFEVAPSVLTAQTNNNGTWIDGTGTGSLANKALGWGFITGGSVGRAGFDNTVSHSGNYSMKVSATTNAAIAVVGSYKTPTTNEVMLLQPNTSYTITGWIKTNNVATNAAFIDFRQYTSALVTITTTSSTKLSGTNDWTQVSIIVTTASNTAFGSIFLRNNIAGNISDVWFDDIIVVLSSGIVRSITSGRTEVI